MVSHFLTSHRRCSSARLSCTKQTRCWAAKRLRKPSASLLGSRRTVRGQGVGKSYGCCCCFCQDIISVSSGLLCRTVYVLAGPSTLSSHRGKPSPCRTTSAAGRQADMGVSASSEAGASHSAPIPARNPYLFSKPIQQQFESQSQLRACIVPSPTALGPVFPELQVAQLSAGAL